MSAYSVKRRVSILREEEIGNPKYNADICVHITQFSNFRNQRLGRHLAADHTLKVKGNHVMYVILRPFRLQQKLHALFCHVCNRSLCVISVGEFLLSENVSSAFR